MRAHSLQHVAFEGLGSLAASLEAAGCVLSCTRFFAGDELPKIEDVDLLVIMGGPMSVNDEQAFPWLIAEKQFIRAVIQAGKPVLGICLGAQLIANALGARVYSNVEKEIGWFPIHSTTGPHDGAFVFPPEVLVFHWHGETFDMPPGATLLAQSAACTHQAFQVGRSVIGLQFHLETTPASAQTMVAHCSNELVPARYVQPAAAILSAPTENYTAINQLMTELLSFLLSHVEAHNSI